ncbi:uncharacterized protein LOC119651469 [Hermetia illucens]|nr:uncharacterized protein LOC119651469 [Hermetia illucens]
MCTRTLALSFCVVVASLLATSYGEMSASELAQDIYMGCLSELSTSCVKPKALGWISRVADQDTIKITDDLSIVRTGVDKLSENLGRENSDPRLVLVDKLDSFLASHALQVRPPTFLRSNEARSMVPDWLLKGGLAEKMLVPLSGANGSEGRGFVRKVMIPFLLGLKFKVTALVPLALALIALKTWKAMTFALLSLVLSGALVIFKLVKPNIVNYEVVPYPPVEHIIDHHHLGHHVDHLGYHADHHYGHHLDHHLDHHLEHLEHPLDHHLDHHLEHHLDHHLDHHLVDHHVEPHLDHIVDHHHEHIDVEHVEPIHVETITEAAPQGWQPSAWQRQTDAQNMAYGPPQQ